MVWILVIALWGGGGQVAVTSFEVIGKEQACRERGERAISELRQRYGSATFTCVQQRP